MEPLRDDQLIADLQALRPTPQPEFAAELDERAAAGFPRRSRLLQRGAPALFTAMRNKGPADLRRLLLPASGAAIAAVAIATILIVANQGGSGSSTPAETTSGYSAGTLGALNYFEGSGSHAKPAPTGSGEEASGTAYEAESQVAGSAAAAGSGVGAGRSHRDVERAAEITLAAKPEDVADDATRVFEAVHAHDGIVMRSSTREGAPGEAGATFELLIPSAQLGDAMAAFSEIDHVRSRHEATADITAPTVSTAELLKESRERIDSLLGQLEAAETEEAREAIEDELRHERRHASRLAAQLTHLHRRADFSRVSLRIETGGHESSGGGAWGIDDALHDAGHVLTVAAAVTLVSLAVLGPIALIALLPWLTHRAWVRRERRRVLG
ncbi:MAG: DUF4349 domain-containing protein [Solirubrobacterales bacterium]